MIATIFTMKNNYEYRDPADLTIHASIKSQPRLPQDHPTMQAMRKGMKRSGPDSREILITNENEIVDGRHWFWNAKALQWDKVRVRVIGADEVHAVILETLANRRHYTKGQLAYLVAPMLDEVFADARNRQLAGLKQGAAAPVLHSVQNGAETPEAMAANLGISLRVLMQAKEIHELFADKSKRTMTDRDGATEKGVTFKEFFEPRILLEEDPEAPRTRAYGLGAVLAGIKSIGAAAGKEHGGGRPQKMEQQLSLFNESLNGFKTKFSYWAKWDAATKETAKEKLPPVVEQMPDDLLAEFAKAIKAELKRREK